MDPNETLRLLREALAKLSRPVSELTPDEVGSRESYVLEAVNYFEALDEWLLSGGFFPAEWQHGVWPADR